VKRGRCKGFGARLACQLITIPLVSSMDLTKTGGRYCTCDPGERTPRQALANSVISCGVCECSNTLWRSCLLMSRNRERAKDLMPPGQESLVIIVDYKSTTLRTNPSISVASKVGKATRNAGPHSPFPGSDHSPTTLCRNARKSHRCKSSYNLELLLQGDFPLPGSRYS